MTTGIPSTGATDAVKRRTENEMQLTETDKKVIRGLHRAVAARGADFVYPDEWKYDPSIVGITGSCVNLLLDGTPACIVGWMAVDQGLQVSAHGGVGTQLAAYHWNVSPRVELLLAHTQASQDQEVPWGASLDQGITFSGIPRSVIEAVLAEEPQDGDIGEPLKHIELEPIEIPATVPSEPIVAPEPEKVPA